MTSRGARLGLSRTIASMNAEHANASGFERRVTASWRSVRRHIPDGAAEAIRVPSKRILRRLGLISGGGRGGASYQR
jgi:hypothetical protein